MLLVGDNGSGKSTLLRVIAGESWIASSPGLASVPLPFCFPSSSVMCCRVPAGRHIFRDDSVMVLGKHAFYDTSLNESRAHLAGDWGRRTVAFTGHGCALQADIGVSEMMKDLQSSFKERRDMLAELLGVDLTWRMHQLSDGQRRRVQIMLQLLRPAEVILLDEITTDLDLITRQDFLTFIKKESEEKGLTIIYATHIFDGLDDWPTHIAYTANQTIRKFGRASSDARLCDFPELTKHREEGVVAPLLRTIEGWLREERNEKKAKGIKITEEAERVVDELRGAAGNGYLSGRFNNGFN
jgi:CCR4-NOT complex subunit CAF16